MDKLKLKDIAPFLPYGLGVKILNHLNDHTGKEFSEINGYYFIDESLHITYNGGNTGKSISEFKPLLRPMSDLTKEITHNGEKFIPIARLLRIKFPDEPLIGRYSIIKISKSGYPRAYFEFMATKEIRIYPFELFDVPHWIIKKLQEWHFDTEKLMERGLAININTLNNGK
ncbi:hypothetical protein GJV56_18940 [Elizabethkingia anophelis]|uniref:hypothetical protein n=1 Tax=Elizabethkingia anophelis TaxID=1117645 RepID=UPI0012B2ADC8|nr:hypothetical protein [Elizabethkingia anophelis]QGN24631.1 hypothetical protein GJV56_18940 [Elizabethkingia anophelis]